MKAEFTHTPLKDSILIIPKNEEEAEDLRRWNNCVLTAKYNHIARQDINTPSLLIVKEI